MPDIPEILRKWRGKIVPAAEAVPVSLEVAAYVTAIDGKFCFRNLPSVKYELRSSVTGGWNITHIYVVVDQEHGANQQIRVEMSLGT